MEAAIAYADAMAAKADQWTLKRVKKLPNQLRAGAEKVDRWKELEVTKHMIGKLRTRRRGVVAVQDADQYPVAT